MVSVNRLALWYASPLPRLRQQAFGEVESLRELADLRLEPEHAIFEVRHTTVRRTGAGGRIGDLPPRHPASIAVVEVARSDDDRSEEHTSELQSRFDLVCRLLL